MFIIECSIFYLAVGVMMDRVACLVELPQVVDNDIKKAERVIRTTANTLFSTLKLQSKKGRPRHQYFRLVHHYLTSLTLEDYTALKEIAKLTRVDKKAINNRTQHFITALTEILDDESNLGTENVSKLDGFDEADRFIEEYMKELEHKVYNSNNSFDSEIEIVKLLMLQESISNATNKIQKELDVWKPNLLESSNSGRRIFRGRSTNIKDYPFMATVQIFGRFTCGGSIIKSDLIVTAASCLQLAHNNRLYRENPAFLSVRVGSTFYEATGERIDVIEVYFHPSYNPKKLNNNIAIMRLQRHINFKSGHVKKIEIDRDPVPLPSVTDRVLVLGWGARTESNIIANAAEDKLAFAWLDFYPWEECREIYSKDYVTRQNFCAGFFSKGGGACNRDVGGPGIVEGVLVGIISFGSATCGSPDSPTVFTKVGYYSEWIDEIMEQEAPQRGASTTTLPRKTIWRIPTHNLGLKGSNKGNSFLVAPVMPSSSPQPTVIINEGQKKKILKARYENKMVDKERWPLQSSDEVPASGKVQYETKMGFTLTTYVTPYENLGDHLPTKTSEKLFTPEISHSDEYSSEEETSQNNRDTIVISSDTGEGSISNQVSSLLETIETSEDTQMTIFEDKLSQDQKLLQDQKQSQAQKLSQDQKPLREDKSLVLPLKETLQFNSRQDPLSQETSQAISHTMSQEISQEILSGETPLTVTVKSPPEMLPSMKSPSELSSRENLPKIKHTNEEDSEEKYFSNENSLDVRGDISKSGSESELSVIPLEIELAGETEKSTEKMPRFPHSTHDAVMPEEMLGTLMDKSAYQTKEPFSDSRLVDPQLALAPSLAKKKRKGNRPDMKKATITLLYFSDNEKDNNIHVLPDNTKPSLKAESDETSEEDISFRAKKKKKPSLRSTNVEKDSNKLAVNDEFSSDILFNILKQAVKNGMFTEQQKMIKKIRKK